MRLFRSIEAVGDLLNLPLNAVLATYRPDGTVLLSPVWHEWSSNGFLVCIGDDVKARHIRRDPRASIVVAEDRRPYRGVETCGRAFLTTDDYQAISSRIATRYLGAEGPDFAAATPVGLVLLLRPDSVRVWDLADQF
jgi:PPOX class probable F420-dependent enzyme